MTKPIVTPQNLESYAFVSDAAVKGPIRSVVLNFHGLGDPGMKSEPDGFDRALGERGALVIFPYTSPWCWMNFGAIRLADEIVQAVYQKFALAPDTPLLSTGGSMGGQCALIYTRYASRTPDACAANCPVCDLPYHATERPDLPRTMFAAFGHYDCGVEEALRMHSPLHQAERMPRIPYFIVHGAADQAVNKQSHSDRFVDQMRACGHAVEYLEVEGMQHCDLGSFPEAEKAYHRFIVQFQK